MSTRSYKDAVEHLNSLQSNAATLDAARAAGTRMTSNGILDTIEYLERIGYKPEDLNAMNVIHITGTKGKGSTSAFTDSILRQTKPDWKIGLYTSPHLVAVRERIRINGQPLAEQDFAKYFFEVWDRLQANTTRKREDTPLMPAYFRFITLVAFHVFLEMKVDATVLEVGVGGTYDCTNIVPKPIVTGVTALGIDHVSVLGKTLKEIAWQKSGIYKPGVPALTVPQPEEGMVVLRERAEELKASDFIITPPVPGLSDLKLGLAGAHQYQNATIAVHLARTFLKARDLLEVKSPLPSSFVEGLKNAKWPGRCQTVLDPAYARTTWYLDGAHTVESLDCCIDWFVSPGRGLSLDTMSTSRRPRVLIFNCTSGRSGPSFLGGINQKIISQLETYKSPENVANFFDEVIFCANVTYADGAFKGDLTAVSIPEADLAQLKTQHQLADAWSAIYPSFPKDRLHVLPSIEHAIRVVRKIGGGDQPADVLVTGSLHLVGGVIEVAGLSEVAL
ncbi:Folylpolyglutamate synthetase [Stygiomarasmius scandens]|uniref:Folylpolyglutamate synthase n=1 Tax=Marasmiellus scandens TaxID=2682957 RepID=A0ABR1K340_9AGAR